jgi:hypothetical protein
MDRNTIFNKVYKHVMSQGQPAVNDAGLCQFEDETGCMCSLGIFLRNPAKFNGLYLGGTTLMKPVEPLEKELKAELLAAGFTEKDFYPWGFAADLMKIHDHSVGKTEKEYKLKAMYLASEVARKYNLTFTESTDG